jgi:KDO2-lipid IV(A) lauroyltransferase
LLRPHGSDKGTTRKIYTPDNFYTPAVAVLRGVYASRLKHSATRKWLEQALAAWVLASLARTPLPVARRLASFYARLLDIAVPRLRRVAMRNLGMALPDRTMREHRRIVDGVFQSISRLLLALAKFPYIGSSNIGEWIRYEGYEHVERALQCGRGVLFAAAHLGNWELSAYAHAVLSGPMHVVVRPLDNPLVDALMARRRALSGNRILDKTDSARAILKALRANEAVGILIDQNSNLEQGTFVDFFGISACSGTGFARLAARTGAVVIPGFALWSEQEQRHVLRFYPPVPITGDAVADTQKLQRVIESVIRQYPDQWLWIHRRWKTRPPGEPPLY